MVVSDAARTPDKTGSSAENMTDYVGQTLEGKYQIVRLLGEGGMGSVYLGRHTLIGRNVAVKVLHAKFAQQESIVRRFYREAQAAAAIGHRGIIEVIDFGVSAESEPFIVMEYLEGESLGSMLKRTGHLELAAALGIMEQTLLALDAAHEKGIVHRDLKPDNIFIAHRRGEPPAVKLIDFGISKFRDACPVPGTQLTQTGTLLGTPSYMSPEQARGISEIDVRSDVYSMGVVLYEMLCGGLPFTGENYNDLLINILTNEPQPPCELNPSFPVQAEAVVLKALARSPADRQQSALAFLEELKTIAEFSKRQEQLTIVASGIRDKTFAAGDLGDALFLAPGRPATDVIASAVHKRTQEAWIAGSFLGSFPRKRTVMGTIVLAAVAALAVGIWLAAGRTDQWAVVPVKNLDSIAAAAPSTDKAPASTVSIQVKGLPPGTRLSWGGKLMASNPFTVERALVSKPLRIEATGYAVVTLYVVPEKDQMLEVALAAIPVPETTKTSAGNAGATARRKPAARRASSEEPRAALPEAAATDEPQAGEPPTSRLKKGKGRSSFAKDFE